MCPAGLAEPPLRPTPDPMTHYAEEMTRLKESLLSMASHAELSVTRAIRALVDHGLRVPEDVSVVGFDDIQSAAFHNPSLTTIRQPLNQMGGVAARILLQRIRGQATFPDTVPIMPELVIRESSCPPGPRRSRGKRT